MVHPWHRYRRVAPDPAGDGLAAIVFVWLDGTVRLQACAATEGQERRGATLLAVVRRVAADLARILRALANGRKPLQ